MRAAGKSAPPGNNPVNRERARSIQLRRSIRAPGQAVFSRGSLLSKKGLHHVVCTLVSAVLNGLSDSVAAPWIKT
jgi:hypothetical protein